MSNSFYCVNIQVSSKIWEEGGAGVNIITDFGNLFLGLCFVVAPIEKFRKTLWKVSGQVKLFNSIYIDELRYYEERIV